MFCAFTGAVAFEGAAQAQWDNSRETAAVEASGTGARLVMSGHQ